LLLLQHLSKQPNRAKRQEREIQQFSSYGKPPSKTYENLTGTMQELQLACELPSSPFIIRWQCAFSFQQNVKWLIGAHVYHNDRKYGEFVRIDTI
jgi:hypothetical protein